MTSQTIFAPSEREILLILTGKPPSDATLEKSCRGKLAGLKQLKAIDLIIVR